MKRLAWAMLIGIVAIAISSFFLIYVVPLLMGPRLPLATISGEWITVHFPADSPVAVDPQAYIAAMEEKVEVLASTAGIARIELPARINLFVHNDEEGAGAIIARRNHPEQTLIFPASVDMVYGEDVRSAFIQLIGDFAVGKNRSRLLRHGIIGYVSRPDLDHHLAVAALPAVLSFNLEELLLIEGRFPLTGYQLFNSPYSPAGFTGMAKLNDLDRRIDPDLMNMAVSFVAFLSEHFGGLPQVMQLWRPGSLDANLQAVYGYSLGEIDQMWREAVVALGPQEENWALVRGRALIRIGHLDEAYSLLQSAYEDHGIASRSVGDISSDIGWIHFLSGEWEEARDHFLQAQGAGIVLSRELRLVEFYSDWETAEAGVVRIHRAPTIGEGETASLCDRAAKLESDLKRMKEFLLTDDMNFPERAIVFLGTLSKPEMLTDLQAGVLVVPSEQEMYSSLAELVVFHLWRDQTLSPLLQRGLVYYLSSPEDHRLHMKSLLHTEDWIPLHLLDFSNFPVHYVEPFAAGLVAYLLESHGLEKFHSLWRLTTPLGGRRSLDTAMSLVYGFTRRELDRLFRLSAYSGFLPERSGLGVLNNGGIHFVQVVG